MDTTSTTPSTIPTTQQVYTTLRPLLFAPRSTLSAVFQLLTPFPSPSSSQPPTPSQTPSQSQSQSQSRSQPQSLPNPLFPSSPSYNARIQSTWLTHTNNTTNNNNTPSTYPSMAQWRGLRTKRLSQAGTSTSPEGKPLKEAKLQIDRLERTGKLGVLDSALFGSFAEDKEEKGERRERDGEEDYYPQTFGDLLMDSLLTGTAQDMSIAEEVLRDVRERGANDLKERLELFLNAANATRDRRRVDSSLETSPQGSGSA
ncbi:hypothetical protein L198_08176 [Cryptococcus wingfieldii CBS 7118]|uniref:Uncharacterized protein n=1 Tax=Cryptococcus wingfieldii CBS 7118 TaxID=1295528 RepID=A0A1E3HF70_9TREE|nr:hypothetical protein L198_08176 [Cryptococcus wingfieldii CBS 7118]ODN74990.1 hypothetical protein L198_08176 [Cryptococcus wingfieldii CBS 7118]